MVKISRKLKNKAIVSFYVDEECDLVFLKGNWNNWEKVPLKKRKDGTYYTKIGIPYGEWEFGYECNGKWIIEKDLEKKLSPFNSYNSVLKIRR